MTTGEPQVRRDGREGEPDQQPGEHDAVAGPAAAWPIVVIEDDPDVQFLIEATFSTDPRFTVTEVVDSAEEALRSPPSSEPRIIVLDHALAGPLPGLAAAPMLREQVPRTKIIMFTAHATLQARCDKDPAIDAFLLKTESERLLPLAQELAGLGATPG